VALGNHRRGAASFGGESGGASIISLGEMKKLFRLAASPGLKARRRNRGGPGTQSKRLAGYQRHAALSYRREAPAHRELNTYAGGAQRRTDGGLGVAAGGLICQRIGAAGGATAKLSVSRWRAGGNRRLSRIGGVARSFVGASSVSSVPASAQLAHGWRKSLAAGGVAQRRITR